MHGRDLDEEVAYSLSKVKISNEEEGPLSENTQVICTNDQLSGNTRGNDLENVRGITFNPSACLQRYNRVREAIQALLAESGDLTPTTIIEFGSSELRFHQHLKALQRVEKLIYVDKDEYTLDMFKQRIRPLSYEYMKKRETPLRVEVYSGCATLVDPRILTPYPSLFAVVGIEIIEHLDPEILTGFERTVFGLLNPPVVIFTTPNSEFNVVFNLQPGKFRHWDHRFEWTRAEFHQWCQRICLTYPGYIFEISGICSGPPETFQYGCVSQMAVFRKLASISFDYLQFQDIIIPDCYRILAYEDYPFFLDPAPRDEQIVRGFKCHISNYIFNYTSLQEYRMEEKTHVRLSVDAAKYISGMPKNTELEEVRVALAKADYDVRKCSDTGSWEIFLKVPDEDEYCSEEDMEDFEDTESLPLTIPTAEETIEMDSEEW